jgi:hypothetical protein
MEKKHICHYCEKTIKGRIDKKFCNDACRSSYNNCHSKKKKSHPIEKINLILQENRDILIKLSGKFGNRLVKEEIFVASGFHFNFHTHTLHLKKQIKYYCYDMGYIKKNDQGYLIVGYEAGL